jgi:hypothetical protein
VQDQRRHVELLQVLGEVGLHEGRDGVVLVLEPAQHALQPERVEEGLGDFRARPVGAVEGHREVLEELRAIGEQLGADLVERLDRESGGSGVGLEQARRHRADQHYLRE